MAFGFWLLAISQTANSFFFNRQGWKRRRKKSVFLGVYPWAKAFPRGNAGFYFLRFFFLSFFPEEEPLPQIFSDSEATDAQTESGSISRIF